MRLLLALLLCCASCCPSIAQNLQGIEAMLERGDHEKAFDKLKKAKERSPSSPEIFYYLSRYYNIADAPQYQPDSAAFYATAAQSMYYQMSANVAQKLHESGLTGAMIDQYKERLDAEGYEKAKQDGSANALQNFVRHHSNAFQREDALRLLSNLAFEEAKNTDTIQGYLVFLAHHPRSIYAQEARKRYHRLVYEQQTQGNSLEDYLQFIAKHPESPHKPDAEMQIFRIFNLEHSREAYQQFLAEFPNSLYAHLAWAWIWELSPSDEAFFQQYPQSPIDAWARQQGQKFAGIPFVENQKIGIFHASNKEIKATFDSLPETMLCKGAECFTFPAYKNGKAGLANLHGETKLPFIYEQVLPLDKNLWAIGNNGFWGLAHAIGFVLAECQYEAIQPFNNELFKVRQNGLWGLISANGYPILPANYQEIAFNPPQLVVLTHQDGKISFAANEVLLAMQPQFSELLLDGYRVAGDRFIIGQQGSSFGVWNMNGQVIVSPNAQQMLFAQNAWLAKYNERWRIYALDGTPSFEEDFEDAAHIPYCCAVKKDGLWGLADPKGFYLIPPNYETISVLGEQSLMLEKNGQRQVMHPAEESFAPTSRPVKALQMKVQTDVAIYTQRRYVVEKNGLYGLLDNDGKPLLPLIYDKIEHLGDSLLLLLKGEKMGLANALGEILLPPIYEGIVAEGKEVFSVLLQGKFGIFNSKTRELPQTPYQDVPKILAFHAENLLVAKKPTGCGLIDLHGRTLVPFIFEEINHWNAEQVLVKHRGFWAIYDLKSNKIEDIGVESLEYLYESATEVVIRTYRNKRYGLRSSLSGALSPEIYSFIHPMGEAHIATYLAEQYDEASETYELFYLSHTGELLRKQTLNKEAYERISCK